MTDQVNEAVEWMTELTDEGESVRVDVAAVAELMRAARDYQNAMEDYVSAPRRVVAARNLRAALAHPSLGVVECMCRCHRDPSVVHAFPCCRLKSATTPAAVDGLTAYARGVAAINSLDDFARMDAGVDAVGPRAAAFSALDELARQLAEARAEIERLNGVVECKTIDANERGNALTASAETKRDLKSQLAEATRRLGEVEGLVGKWRGSDYFPSHDARDCADELEAALTKKE